MVHRGFIGTYIGLASKVNKIMYRYGFALRNLPRIVIYADGPMYLYMCVVSLTIREPRYTYTNSTYALGTYMYAG